ncbi:PQQ-binding-like beta-propeller repeat protein [Actinoplanes sp. TBRC 11911]|uniref:outer membrane protein assembly factor BamB family protein n=1 Tax=Actinoplanes sp. TBRC 11911 TaxID=2729386 RepID=UPI00145CC4F8|nr:PQQ-binding-like beta-propeller repeat protein [Actinoplanes sp. TBRC 11911]NMO52090.1 PQQ-binding-like beta-propeller repeat protein [Actinoplanes sp. TBRC 11911]
MTDPTNSFVDGNDHTDERLRATPVDPWAAAEAAALPTAADLTPEPPSGWPTSPTLVDPPSGWASPPGAAGPTTPAGSPVAGVTTPPAAAARRGLLLRPYMIVLVLILVVGAGVWVFWPGGSALDYQPLSEPRRIAPVVPVGSDWSDAEIIGKRVYFASSDAETGAVGVVAMDVGADKPAWTSLKAGTAARWKSMVALPDGVALFTDPDSAAGTRRIAVLDADRGDLRWQRTIADDDEVFFAGKSAVVTDHAGKRLLGLNITDGDERWSRNDPAGTSSIAPAVLTVTTPKDLDGPATVSGRPYQPSLTDDPRIVEVGADKSVQVLNADTGKVETSRQNVADPDDEMVAHNGRLIVLQPQDQRIVSYDLTKLGEPRVLYTAQEQNARMKAVTPCGDDRVCFGEETGYDGKTDKVVALDVAGGKRLWQYPVADIDTLVPVGQAVVASSLAGQTTLIDDAGRQIWTRTGEAARLDGGNLLEFSKPLTRSPDNPAVAGRHLGDEAVPLGYLSDIRSDTCSWDTSIMACAADKDFVLQTFAK